MQIWGASFVAQLVKICLQWRRPRFESWVGKIPWRRKWQSTPVLLPGKSHGQRSLVGYSPWGRKESDTTERLYFTFPCDSAGKESTCNVGDLGSIPGLGRSPGEGHGNPLRYLCLDNPIDFQMFKLVLEQAEEPEIKLPTFAG